MLGLVEEDPSTLTPFDHGCQCLNGNDTTEIQKPPRKIVFKDALVDTQI